MRRSLVVGGIVAVAAALRFWGLGHGLPFTMGRPDEAEALLHTADFPSGDLNPRWFVYPNLFFWMEWAWLELALAVRRLVTDTPDYRTMLATALPTLIFYGRVLSALAGVATVWATYAIGRRAGGVLLGLTAALLLATCFLHVRDSHALKADVFLALAVPVAIYALARFMEAPGHGTAAAAGIAIGIATGLKYPGVVLLIPAYVAMVWTSSRRGLARLLPERPGLELVAVAVVTFLASCPYLLLDQERLLQTFTFSVKVVYGMRPEVFATVDGVADGTVTWARTRTFLYHFAVSLWHGCGPGAAVLMPVAVALGLRRSEHPMLRLSAVMVPVYYVVISISQVTLARYLTPVTPLIALLVARLVVVVVERTPAPAARRAVWTALVALLVGPPLAASIAHDRIAAETDTRVLATRWMAEHLPAGAAVARVGSHVFMIADPELPAQVRAVELELGDHDLDRHGATHVVTHEHPLPFSRPDRRLLERYRDRLTLLFEVSPWAAGPAGRYEELDAFYVPYADFGGVVRPGPLVRIYRLEPQPPNDGHR